jgi:Fic family protein
MQDVLNLIERYQNLGIAGVLDHEKFNHISIVHHSTRIEGSTLTEIETQVLLVKGLTPKGKPLQDSLMVTDHYAALQFCLKEVTSKRPVSDSLIQEVNSLVNKNTGNTYHTIFGVIDTRTGAFRKGNVSAGTTYFPNYDKVIPLTEAMVLKINEQKEASKSLTDRLNLSFDAHFNLVSIHPFYDGNGRTSRLLMNYIQAYYDLPLAIIHEESKAEYIEALVATREKNDIEIFRKFMQKEYAMLLQNEISSFEQMNKPKGKGFNLLF